MDHRLQVKQMFWTLGKLIPSDLYVELLVDASKYIITIFYLKKKYTAWF